MSKRGAIDQGGKDTGLVSFNEDRSTETAERASTDVMSRRKTAVPKSRRRPGAPGVEALGNIFGSNPSPAFGAPQQPSTQNSQSNNIFGGLTSFQPQTPFASINAPTNGAPSLFGTTTNQAPPASTASKNIFGSNASTGFSFGTTSNSFNNPFAQHSADQVQNNNTLFATPTISTPFKGFGTTPTQSSDQNPFQPTTPLTSTSPKDQSMVSPPNNSDSQAIATNSGTPFTNNSSANQASNLFGTPTPTSSSLFTPKPDTPSSTMPYEVHGQQVNSLWAKPGQVDGPPVNRKSKPLTGLDTTPSASASLASPKSTESQTPTLSAESSNPFLGKPNDSQNPTLSSGAASSNPFLGKPNDSQNPTLSSGAASSNPFLQKPGDSQNPTLSTGAASSNPFLQKPGSSQALSQSTSVESSNPFVQKPGSSQALSQSAGAAASNPFLQKPSDAQNPTPSTGAAASNPFLQKLGGSQALSHSSSAESSTKLPVDGHTPTKSDSAPGKGDLAASEAELPSFAEANLASADPTAPGAFMVAAQFLNAQGTLERFMHEQGVTFTLEEKQKFLKALQMRFITKAFQECVSKANGSNDLSQVCRAYIAQTEEIKAGVYFKLPSFKRKATDSVDTTKTKAPRVDSGPQSNAPQSGGQPSRSQPSRSPPSRSPPSSSPQPRGPQSKTANLVQGIVDGPSAPSAAPSMASPSSSVFDSPPAADNIFGNVAPTAPLAPFVEDEDSSDNDEPPQSEPAQSGPARPGAGLSLFDRVNRETPSEERRRPEGSDEERHFSPDDGRGKSVPKMAEPTGSTVTGWANKTWKGDSNSPLKFGTAAGPVNGASTSGADDEESTTPGKNGSSLSGGQSRPFADLTAGSTAKPKQRSLFGMDGAADGPTTVGDKTPTPSLFGKASTTSGSLFSPKPGPAATTSGSLFSPTPGSASAAGPFASISRASTPAELSDATSVNASEDEGEEGEAQSDMTALSAAERRQEEVLFEVKAKLMQHSKDDKKEPIKTVGTGPLRVLKNRETQAVRMLMRCAPRGQVVLNATLQAGMVFKKKQKSTLQFGAPDPAGSFQMWFVRTGLDSRADELVAMLEQQTPKG